jgi:SAM-dependent methyltransferase
MVDADSFDESIQHLNQLRIAEGECCAEYFPKPSKTVRLLEIGAGTGVQASEFDRAGYSVTAIDLDSSAYARSRVFPVMDYDGRNLPFTKGAFEVVFSSNVLEHVADLLAFIPESARVLTDDGICVHVIPTPAWRIWSQLTHYAWIAKRMAQLALGGRKLKGTVSGGASRNKLHYIARSLVAPRHGERGNFLTEALYYRKRFWIGQFALHDLALIETRPAGIFYTESSVIGSGLSISARRFLASILGSACTIYVLRKAGSTD